MRTKFRVSIKCFPCTVRFSELNDCETSKKCIVWQNYLQGKFYRAHFWIFSTINIRADVGVLCSGAVSWHCVFAAKEKVEKYGGNNTYAINSLIPQCCWMLESDWSNQGSFTLIWTDLKTVFSVLNALLRSTLAFLNIFQKLIVHAETSGNPLLRIKT